VKKLRFGTVLALALVLPGCSSLSSRQVTVAIPLASPAAVANDKEIVVMDFIETSGIPDCSLGRKLAEYLETEIRREFKGKVSRRGAPPGEGATTPGAEFWRSAVAGLDGAAVLAGSVGLSQDVQKALRDIDIPKDGPFKLENRGLLERKRFILTFQALLIDAVTGEVILKKDFKETRFYTDIEQTAEFALFDLFPLVKAKLFPALFGRQTTVERYLLVR
jgi:hypothetical protein